VTPSFTGVPPSSAAPAPLSTPAIVGIGVGSGVAGIAALAAAVFYVVWHRRHPYNSTKLAAGKAGSKTGPTSMQLVAGRNAPQGSAQRVMNPMAVVAAGGADAVAATAASPSARTVFNPLASVATPSSQNLLGAEQPGAHIITQPITIQPPSDAALGYLSNTPLEAESTQHII
jgi:hypothetical protein